MPTLRKGQKEFSIENQATIEVDGRLINVDEKDLCPNDLVVIQVEDIVPADLALTESRSLEVDEFEITGELLPVHKTEKGDIIFKGSRVTNGIGKGLVVAVGDHTEYGRILKQGLSLTTPQKYSIFDHHHLWMILLYLPAIFSLFLQENSPVMLGLLFIFFTLLFNILQNDALFNHLIINLGNDHLERANIQVRDPRVLEQMKDIGIFCFDKTGVLTTRTMSVKKIYLADRIFDADKPLNELSDKTANIINLACALCNDVHVFEKLELANPIDQALIMYAQKNGVDVKSLFLRVKRFFDQSFQSENRYMAAGFETDDSGKFLFVKGDPDVISKMCFRYLSSDGMVKEMDEEIRYKNKSAVSAIVRNGDTVIALAYQPCVDNVLSQMDLTFLGLLQLENSLQPETRGTIKKISEKGYRSLLLTGDKTETAVKIGEESGIATEPITVLTGKVIEKMGWADLTRQASYCSIFAKLTPSQKGALILGLQQSGYKVVMVGDGPNDGIALKVADIGISLKNNSSSIARKLSKILINNLNDLTIIIDQSLNVKMKIWQVKISRYILSAALLLGVYLWAFQ